MPIGKISFWDEARGFGRIRADNDSGRGLFVHVSDLGHVSPMMGDRFEFEPGLDKFGRDKAVNVRPVSAAREEASRVFGDE